MEIRSPRSDKEFEDYFYLRWKILRKPWGQPRGSEKGQDEDDCQHIIAVDDQHIAAVARLQKLNPRQAQLRYMAVDECYRKQGLGKAIVLHAETLARQQGCQEMMLHARENALGFYQHLGYQLEEKSYVLFDSIQHYKMKKTLTPKA